VRIAAAAFVTLLLGAWPARAQQPAPAAPYVGRAVTAIVVSIEGRATEDPSLKEAIQTKVNAPLDMADVRETISHLYSLGRFEDVRVEASDAGANGVALRYELAPIHTVTKVDFTGELGLSEGTLRTRMIERFGATPPLSRANDVASALEDLYQERGYLSASVKPGPPIVEHEPHRATLVLQVNAGPRTIIAKSDITGQPLESPDKARERLQISAGAAYQPADLKQRLADYVTWMRKQGHYEASAHEEPPVFTADKTRVNVAVNVEPGPRVTISYTGDPLPKDKLADLVPIEREGSVDQDILEDSARRIVEYLNQAGYWKAEVKPPVSTEKDGTLTLVFDIRRGQQYHVSPGGADISGNTSIPIEDLRPLLKMKAGDPFVGAQLGASEAAIRQLYRSKGFATAQIASSAGDAGNGLVKPAIVITEGPRVTIGSVTIAGATGVPADTLMTKIALKRGDPYYGPAVAQARDTLLGELLNAGYASARVTVTGNPPPSAAGATAVADLTFAVDAGPQTIVDHILLSGNVHTKQAVIMREVRFKPGQPLGLDDLTETRRRLTTLGLFRRIQIAPLSHGDPSKTDVIITVEEAQQSTIGYGGGLQIDRVLTTHDADLNAQERYEFSPRGFFEIGRRNLGGTDRSVNLYTRLSLRPSTNQTTSDLFGFSEYRVVGTYREPRAFGSRADLTGTAAVEQGVRTGFNFARKGLNAETTRRIRGGIRASVRYSFSTTRVFDFDPNLAEDQATIIDRAFAQVRLSAFSAAFSQDTRDDLLDPQRGVFVSGDATVAARAIGSEVGFAKTFIQGFIYRNLGRPNLVFAGGARLGVAQGFPRLGTVIGENGQPQVVSVRDLPISERFFAGGDTTIRGYALDLVGTPATITPAGFPVGGDAEVIFNAELRAHLFGPIGGVLFVDTGNVYPRTADLDLSNMLTSLGTGIRVKTPIGPIRLDVGFKTARRVIGGSLEPGYAIHFSIGQAF
jgi:outer membrane protein insertion porin family